MNPKNTWRWLLVAAVLFAFIFFVERHLRKPAIGPIKLLPRLNSAAVTSVQIRPKGQPEIRVERTNGFWQMTQPLRYPAQAAAVEGLLSTLERLVPATSITRGELKGRPRADEEYGFAEPQASILIEQGADHIQLLIGIRTAPGDQVFLQVVGLEAFYVVDAELLKFIPSTVNDWRENTLISLKDLVFDRLAVTNGAKIFELRRDATNGPWRMILPFPARAASVRIEDALEKLQDLRIHQFVNDDPKADLESIGLQPPELEVAFSQGTNAVALLQFGKSCTNAPNLVYARRLGLNTIVTVATNLLAAWRAPINDFRDPHLVALADPVEAIDVRGQDIFSVQRQPNNTWRVLPQNFQADSVLVKELLSALSAMEVQFVKDVVTEPDLPAYGLASPTRLYVLTSAPPDPAASATNRVIAELYFGANQDDKVFARRSDESFVYAVKLGDLERLPSASWQLRERQIWTLSENDIDRVTIRQQSKVRQIIRNAQYKWSLAPGSQGVIDNFPVEETVRGLCHLAAAVWVAHGAQNRAKYGFADNGHQITLELKSGDKVTVEFGGEAPSTFRYAAVALEGEPWIFEFPPLLYRDLLLYLSVPADP